MSKLQYIPLEDIKTLRQAIEAENDTEKKLVLTGILADVFRLNALYMIAKADAGHIGTSFSCMDILTLLWTGELKNPNDEEQEDADIFISSNGHEVPALYSVMLGTESLPFEKIHELPGHPDVDTAIVSVGRGISKARGMVVANRLQGKTGRAFVLVGDEELQEGQFWESLQSTVNGECNELTVIVDYNNVQAVSRAKDGRVLEARLRAFGWEVARCDGNSMKEVRAVLDRFASMTGKPKILLADTVKGKGVPFMEKMEETEYGPMYAFQSGAPSEEDYVKAHMEIQGRINAYLFEAGLSSVSMVQVERPERPVLTDPQKLVPAYAEELVRLGKERDDIVVCAADQAVDLGLLPFRKEFPDHFVECGMAEQDMVSMAGGLAARGMLPIVHSSDCILASRSNEQIIPNATEHRKIIYVGSMPSTPGMIMIQPCTELEARLALRWAAQENEGSTYVRLETTPVDMPFRLPVDHALVKGKGLTIATGSDAVIFACGPVMVSEAYKAAGRLKGRGFGLKVVSLPWLNYVDAQWLEETIEGCSMVFTLGDHFVKGGQGEMLAAEIAGMGKGVKVARLGSSEVPHCGLKYDALKAHGLDAASLRRAIQELANK